VLLFKPSSFLIILALVSISIEIRATLSNKPYQFYTLPAVMIKEDFFESFNLSFNLPLA
jgi:hypothetical protein